MKRQLILTAIFLGVILVGTAQADNCSRIKPHLDDAKMNIITAFAEGDTKTLEQEIANLIFWDAYAQIECDEGDVVDTPIRWLSNKANTTLTPYLAGFLFWLDYLKRYRSLELTPAELVRARSFD